jgi:hypothetical protein
MKVFDERIEELLRARRGLLNLRARTQAEVRHIDVARRDDDDARRRLAELRCLGFKCEQSLREVDDVLFEDARPEPNRRKDATRWL